MYRGGGGAKRPVVLSARCFRVRLDIFRFPCSTQEHKNTCYGNSGLGNCDRSEYTPYIHGCVEGQIVRQRDLEQPGTDKVDPCGRPGITGAIECLGGDHAECEQGICPAYDRELYT